MRAPALSIILPLGLLVACGGEPARDTAMSADLTADLTLAASGSVELASAALDDSARFSFLESTPAPSPERTAAPRRAAPRTRIPRATPEPTPEPPPAPAPAAAVEEPRVVAEAPAPSDLPVATRPVPVSFPTGGGAGAGGAGGRAGDGGVGSGGWPIGVVIRGGGTGDDCEIHDRRRRGGRGRIPVIVTIPARTGGMGGGTFPGAPHGLPRF